MTKTLHQQFQQFLATKPVASDAELAQAYAQGYQDGRRAAAAIVDAYGPDAPHDYVIEQILRTEPAFAKVAQEQERKA